jgi:hypothetical protein
MTTDPDPFEEGQRAARLPQPIFFRPFLNRGPLPT